MTDTVANAEEEVEADEEVTITGTVTSRDPDEQEVCFGMVDGAQVSAFLTPAPSPKATGLFKDQWPMIRIRLGRQVPKRGFIIAAWDGQGRDFGSLHSRVAYGIAPLLDSGFISRLQGRLLNRKKEPYATIHTPLSASLPLLLNIYGKRKHAEAVTKSLVQKKIFLRRPMQIEKNREYFNPCHDGEGSNLKLAGQTRPFGNPSGLTRTIGEIESSVMRIFDTSQEATELSEMEADAAVIRTPLLPHQKQALQFMTIRELDENEPEDEGDSREVPIYRGNSLWRVRRARNGNVHYHNVIADNIQPQKPALCRGGILADMMGLGKTLSVLSLCASTMFAAEVWATTFPVLRREEQSSLKNIKSTLLVAPLSVLANW